MEITAVKHQMWRAEAPRRRLAELEPVPRLAGSPMAQFACDRHDVDLGERVFQTERVEHAGSVRADLKSGARLLELARLFVDLDIDPAPEQRERRRESADAAADDDDLVRRHPTGRPLAQ